MFSISDSFISPLVHFITNYFCPLSVTVSQPSGSTVEEEHEQDDDVDGETMMTTMVKVALKNLKMVVVSKQI